MYGWKNAETCSVKSYFDWRTPQDICGTESVTAEELRQRVESLIDTRKRPKALYDIVFSTDDSSAFNDFNLALSLAAASLDAVDWEEVAEAINAEPLEVFRTKNRSAEMGGPFPMID